MKSITRLTLVFLLMLYIGPMILAPSFISPSRQNEPNMTKDFAPATEYETSNQSITSFAEPLPDDVMYYPDAFWNGTTGLAYWGTAGPDSSSHNYTYTWDDKGNDYEGHETTSGTSYVILNFTLPSDSIFESFDYAVHGEGYNDDDEANLWVYDWSDNTWNLLGSLGIGIGIWRNGTGVGGANFTDGTQISLKANSTDADNPSGIAVAIAHLTIYVMTLADSNHFAEGFSDASDWETPASGTTGATMTSDGDLATITENGPINLGVAYVEFASTNYFEYYYEFRIESMTATIAYLMFWDTLDLLDYIELKSFSDPGTYKGIISNSDVNSTRRIGFIIDSNNDNITVDYLRISPANESGGWAHDGSTIAGTYDTGGVDISTDGDKLTFTADAENEYGHILFDTTTTAAIGENNYYPFLHWNIYSATDNDADDFVYNIRLVGAGGSRYLGQTKTTGDIYYNVLADTAVGDFSQWRIYVDNGDSVVIDFVKYYGIVNFTITQSGVGTDDYLYVDSGVLYSNIDTGYIEADHDPALSFETNRSLWTMTTSSGTPQIDFYIDAAWVGYTSATSGSFPSGTLTDLRLNFTDNANIEAITFLSPIPQWNEVGVAILYFSVPFDMWGYNTGLIILGLVMIPVSTIYLAYGIKHDRSSNRLFYGLIIFFLGFGLLIGGILP